MEDWLKQSFKNKNTAIYYLKECWCLPCGDGNNKPVRITGVCLGNGVVFFHRGILWFAYGNDEEGKLGTFNKIGG